MSAASTTTDDKKNRRTRADTTLGAPQKFVSAPTSSTTSSSIASVTNTTTTTTSTSSALQPTTTTTTYHSPSGRETGSHSKLPKRCGSYPPLTKRTTGACKCSLTQILTKFPIGRTKNADYHVSYTTCATCRQRGPEYLCLKCTKAFCEEHVQKHFESDRDHSLYLFNELVRYEEAFYCFKCESFSVIEPFDEYLDAMFGSKGSFLDIPVTGKHSELFEYQGRVAATCTMQGWRSANEDSHCVHLSMPTLTDCDYFGVFDGHGGPLVSRYAGTRLVQILEKKFTDVRNRDMQTALSASFLVCDTLLQTDGTLSLSETGSCGSTANVVVFDRAANVIYCANAGDARAVLCRNGKAYPLSVDHRPANPSERERIQSAGSHISEDERVDGLLAVSRALGDFDFKQANSLPADRQAVTCAPEVSTTPYQKDMDHFIVLACDGVWDVLTSQQVVDLITQQLRNSGNSPLRAVEALLERCVAKDVTPDGLGTDNMSVVLVMLK